MELARDGAALAREQVLADERLPRFQLVAGELPHPRRHLPDELEPQLSLDPVEAAQGERHLGQARVPGPLSHAVDRPVDPGRTGPNGRDCGGRGEAEVVVAVEVHGHAEPLTRSADELRRRFRGRDAERVDHDDLAGACLDRRVVGSVEEARIRACAVDTEVRDRDAALDREGDRGLDPLQHLLPRDPERLELQVRDRRLDHARGQAELEERLDVRLHRAGEAPDLGAQARVANQLDRPPVLRGDAREPGLDPLDPELVERARDLQLLLGVEDDSDGLLAVPKRRVVEADLRLEAVRVVDRAGPEAHRKSSGQDESFCAPSLVTT